MQPGSRRPIFLSVCLAQWMDHPGHHSTRCKQNYTQLVLIYTIPPTGSDGGNTRGWWRDQPPGGLGPADVRHGMERCAASDRTASESAGGGVSDGRSLVVARAAGYGSAMISDATKRLNQIMSGQSVVNGT